MCGVGPSWFFRFGLSPFVLCRAIYVCSSNKTFFEMTHHDHSEEENSKKRNKNENENAFFPQFATLPAVVPIYLLSAISSVLWYFGAKRVAAWYVLIPMHTTTLFIIRAIFYHVASRALLLDSIRNCG